LVFKNVHFRIIYYLSLILILILKSFVNTGPGSCICEHGARIFQWPYKKIISKIRFNVIKCPNTDQLFRKKCLETCDNWLSFFKRFRSLLFDHNMITSKLIVLVRRRFGQISHCNKFTYIISMHINEYRKGFNYLRLMAYSLFAYHT